MNAWEILTWVCIGLSWVLLARSFWVRHQDRQAPHFDPSKHLLAVWVDHGGDIHLRAAVEVPEDVIGDVLIEAAALYQSNRPDFKEASPWLD